MKVITENRRVNLINGIQDVLEEKDFNEFEHGFLEDIQKNWLQKGKDLTDKQWQYLIRIAPEVL